MPRTNIVANNLQMMSQNAGRVNVFMLSGYSLRIPGYGDRSFETMNRLTQGMNIPDNINIMQIEGFDRHVQHSGLNLYLNNSQVINLLKNTINVLILLKIIFEKIIDGDIEIFG